LDAVNWYPVSIASKTNYNLQIMMYNVLTQAMIIWWLVQCIKCLVKFLPHYYCFVICRRLLFLSFDLYYVLLTVNLSKK